MKMLAKQIWKMAIAQRGFLEAGARGVLHIGQAFAKGSVTSRPHLPHLRTKGIGRITASPVYPQQFTEVTKDRPRAYGFGFGKSKTSRANALTEKMQRSFGSQKARASG
jgi:hypothetical protein